MKIERKLILSNIINGAFIILISFFAFQNLNLVLTKLRFVEIADDLNATFLEMRLSEKNYFLYKDRKALDQIQSNIEKTMETISGVRGDITMGIIQQRSFSVTAAPVHVLEASQPEGSPGISAGEAPPAVETLPSGAVVVLHDLTELRRLERVRQDFVANVSHEFKTPLTAIQGFAETLLAGALDDPKNNRRFLEILPDHAPRLGRQPAVLDRGLLPDLPRAVHLITQAPVLNPVRLFVPILPPQVAPPGPFFEVAVFNQVARLLRCS